MRPDEIDAAQLPRVRVGGYNPQATEELLKQVAWDYRQLLHERAHLVERSVELERRSAELEQRVQELERQRDVIQSRQQLAISTVASAQQAAREAREESRAECELMLKKARRRVHDVDQTIEKALSARAEEIRALETAQQQLQEQLRTFLSVVLASVDRHGAGAVQELAAELGEAAARAAETTERTPQPVVELPTPRVLAEPPGAERNDTRRPALAVPPSSRSRA